jgi:hypothetical protein
MHDIVWHQFKKHFSSVKWLVLIGVSLAVLWWCAEIRYGAPSANTDAYRALHGVYRGKASELRIGGVLFRFPAGYMPEPYTGTRDARKIVQGQAGRANIFVDLSTGRPLPTQRRAEGAGVVRIEIIDGGYEADKKIEDHFLRRRWTSIKERPELGLREYIKDGELGGWGGITYEPLDLKLKTPRGGRYIFKCEGNKPGESGVCGSYYQHPKGPSIQYYFASELFFSWRTVNAEVIKLVDSLIVEE